MNTLRRILRLAAVTILALLVLGASSVPPGDQLERARAFTRSLEFDYVTWTLNALGVKLSQLALGTASYLPVATDRQVVLDYIALVREIQGMESQLGNIYSDPSVQNPEAASASLRADLAQQYQRRSQLGPLAESILQKQLAQIVSDLGLSLGGQPVPPILYHSTPLPMALIISPRDTIRQDADISLIPDLTVDQQAKLEDEVDDSLNVSSLVVGIGGVGVYPTMVMQTSDLNWLTEVVAHEWTHNFLTLRPLGISYLNSPELRTMNETTASLAGKEIGRALIERYYPELLPPPPQPSKENTAPQPSTQQPAFDFRAEMHTTRITVDQMLAAGQIYEAEAYMETRRVFFWDHGYRIRKINQAYFAFYGAYADQPGGAAGADPVGSAVRALRVQSPSLAAFLNQISWMSTFEQLQGAIGGG